VPCSNLGSAAVIPWSRFGGGPRRAPLKSGDRDGLRAIVEILVRSTRDVEQTNQALEARLRASKKEINQLQENLESS